VGTIVMGCTHYPLLKNVVQNITGQDVVLIDPAFETAGECRNILVSHNMMREDTALPSYKYYVSDDPDKFTKVGSTFLEKKIDGIEKIDVEGY